MKLGQKVQVKAVLYRDGLEWKREALAEPLEGIISGKRTLWDSYWDSEGWEFPWTRYLVHFGYAVSCYLISINLKQIVRASPEDIKEM